MELKRICVSHWPNKHNSSARQTTTKFYQQSLKNYTRRKKMHRCWLTRHRNVQCLFRTVWWLSSAMTRGHPKLPNEIQWEMGEKIPHILWGRYCDNAVWLDSIGCGYGLLINFLKRTALNGICRIWYGNLYRRKSPFGFTRLSWPRCNFAKIENCQAN